MAALPVQRTTLPAPVAYKPKPRPRRERNVEADRALAEHFVARIGEHRIKGRSALLVGDLDTAAEELWSARSLELDLDRLGAAARPCMPADWEIETDLTPLARALSSQAHPRAADTWRRLMDDRPARSIQAEAAEWLAREALAAGERRTALRRLHAASQFGRPSDPAAFQVRYRQADIDPAAAFCLYLVATRLDKHSARAVGLRDPLTDAAWADQDARWWMRSGFSSETQTALERSDHQTEALHRARDLARTKREQGWLLLAEGDHVAGPMGVRALGRAVRFGSAETADEDSFVRIRLAYEGAADRLPDVAWPWYRLAELMAWAGFAQRAEEHLAQAERRSLGKRETDRTNRPALRALVQAGLGTGPDGLPAVARPFPAVLFCPSLITRLGLR